MTIKTFTFNPFYENTYLLHDETGECVIVDPGCHNSEEKKELKDFIESNNLKPVGLLNTHCHIDHVLGNAYVSKEWGLSLQMHKDDVVTLTSVSQYAHLYGFNNYELSPEPEIFLNEGDVVSFGNNKLNVIFVPGHAPGHIAFIDSNEEFAIAGDVLFQGSIGRTDLPGGSFEILEKSIREKMYTLKDDCVVYPGHGPTTTIGAEKMGNPFVRP